MDILCIGEMLADIIVTPVFDVTFDNDCTPVEQIIIKPGGDAFNNSIDLAKLGHDVIYVGRIGNDAIGDYLLKAGIQAGVCMDYIVPSPNPHAKMNILIDKHGDRSFFYFPGTSAEFCFEDINLTLLNHCKIIEVGGTFHLPRFDGPGTARLFKEAQNRNVITSMDVTKDFTGRWNEIIYPCYPYLDYFLPSIEQAELIAGTSQPEEIADNFLAQGVKNVVIKLGKKGCYFKNKQKSFYCSCYLVQAVETTGAGDAFVSGFLTGVLKNLPEEQCVTLGTACSAFAVQAVGATTGVPDYETLQKFICSSPALEITYLDSTIKKFN